MRIRAVNPFDPAPGTVKARVAAAIAGRPVLLVVLPACVVVLLIATQPLDFLVRHLKDDSFYYFQTARNIASGHGSTFDGINRTNGYHPLWMLNLLPLYWLFPADAISPLRMALLLMACYHVGTAVILYRTLAPFHGVGTAVAGALAWALCPPILRLSFDGLESSLYSVVLASLIFVVAVRFKDAWGAWVLDTVSRGTWLVAGLLLAATLLARLDAVFVAGGLGLALGVAWLRGRRRDITPAILLSLPSVVLCGAYLGHNYVAFGHVVPVSGLLKRPEMESTMWVLGRLLWPLDPVAARLGVVPTFVVALLVLAIATIAIASLPGGRQALGIVVRRHDWLILGAISLYAYCSLSGTPYASWYYVPLILLFFVAGTEVVAFAGAAAAGRGIARLGLPMALASVIAGIYIGLARMEFDPRKNDVSSELLSSAAWVSASLPDAAIGAAWNAGVLGYFSGRRVVNLDGLINSYEFARALQERREPAFLLCEGVGYVFDVFPVPAAGGWDASELIRGGEQWWPYLQPYAERLFSASNVGVSSYFHTWFPERRRGSPFVFKVWRLVPPGSQRTGC